MKHEINLEESASNIKDALTARSFVVLSEMMDNPDQLVPRMSKDAERFMHMNYARIDHPEDVKGDAGAELPSEDIDVVTSVDKMGADYDSNIEDAFNHAIHQGGDVVITLADGNVVHIDPHTAITIKNSVLGQLHNYLGSIESFAALTSLSIAPDEVDEEYEDSSEGDE